MHRIRNSLPGFTLVSLLLAHMTLAQNTDTQVPVGIQQPLETQAYEQTPAAETAPETYSAQVPAEQPPAPAPRQQQTHVAPSTVQPVASIENTESENAFLRTGIGVQCGIRFHQPKEFNDFTSDVWNSFLINSVYGPIDKKTIGPGILLTLNGTFDIGNYFQAAPFAQGMWAGRQFYFRGGMVSDLHVNTYTAMGGVNLWLRVLNRERHTLRVGACGYGAYTIARITGDIADTKLSGSGYGLRGLVGTEFRLNKKVVITLDCSVPWGVSTFTHKTNELRRDEPSVTYPEEFEHLGFEVCPGVMFYF